MQQHSFFKSIDWEKLAKKEIRPLFRPRVESKSDLSNIDRFFTREEPCETPEEDSILRKDKFPAFTYVDYQGDLLNMTKLTEIKQESCEDLAEFDEPQ